MGTNYTLYRTPLKRCECCGHIEEPSFDNQLHIGKSSGGWVFSLHVIPELGIHDLPDWVPLFEQGTIKDEYGAVVTPEEMMKIITERSWPHRNWETDDWHCYRAYRDEADFHQKNHSLRGPNGLLRHQLGRWCTKHGEGTWDCIPGDFS